MHPRGLPYACTVCRWQGTMEPTDPGHGAYCPQCGTLLYPRSWAGSWGLVVVLVLATLAFVWAAATFRP